MANITPLADRIVAVAVDTEQKTSSGLYLPENAQEKPQMAKVVAVGKDVKEVKKDDTIVYGKFGATELKIGDAEYLILKEEDVLGLVK